MTDLAAGVDLPKYGRLFHRVLAIRRKEARPTAVGISCQCQSDRNPVDLGSYCRMLTVQAPPAETSNLYKPAVTM